jgi:hypothetical protein
MLFFASLLYGLGLTVLAIVVVRIFNEDVPGDNWIIAIWMAFVLAALFHIAGRLSEILKIKERE